FLPAAFRRAASHLLGPASGRSPRTTVAQFWAMHSQIAWSPPHWPALANAVPYLLSTLLTQAARSDGSPLAATLAWQAMRPFSFFAIAFSLAPVHLSGPAGTVSTGTRMNGERLGVRTHALVAVQLIGVRRSKLPVTGSLW